MKALLKVLNKSRTPTPSQRVINLPHCSQLRALAWVSLLTLPLASCGNSPAKEKKAVPPAAEAPISQPGGSDPLPKPPEKTALWPGAAGFWIDPDSLAAQDARTLFAAQSDEARRLRYVADQPMAQWLGEWTGDVESRVRSLSLRSEAANQILTLVAYNVPYRDCGSHSAGGVQAGMYRQWIESIARGLGSRRALLILEPDSLAQMDCLAESARNERMQLLRDAVMTLKRASGLRVYLDAGHPGWKSPETMAERLQKSGVDQADGFSLNVSNFQTTEANIAYGSVLRARLNGKAFVIDSSRNGLGPDPQGQWCNPRNRALGKKPTLQTGVVGLDALLWVRRPGESDGSCNGGPGAGQWWREMALELAAGAGI